MDAAHTLLKNIALFFALALFGIAPGLQAQSFGSPGSGSIVTLTISGADVSVTSTGGAIAFTATLSNFQAPAGDTAANWVSITGGASGTTPATVSFGSLHLGAYQGTYTATVTLHATGVTDSTFTVQYVSGSGGGGGGQSGTITATPASVPLSASPGSGTSASATVTLSTASSTAIPFTMTYTPLGTWLQSSTAYSSVAAGSNAFVNVSASAFNLSAGTYNGSVTITPTSGGAATTVQVTFTVGTGGGTGTITSNINPVSLTYTSSGSLASQFVTLTTSTGASNYTATATSFNNWLLVNSNLAITTAYSGGLTIAVGSIASSLGTGSYTGTVQLTDTNGGTGSITVNLTVNGGSSGLTISPSPITMSAPIGFSTGNVPVTVISNVGGTLSVTPQNAPWLSIVQAPSSISAGTTNNVYISASAAGYTTNLTLAGSLIFTVGGQQQNIQVTFIVGTGSGGGGGGGTSGFAVAPTSLAFFYQVGTSRQSVAQQVVGITGGSGVNWNAILTVSSPANGSWLLASTLSAKFQDDGTSSTTVQIDPTGLTAGTYTGNLAINAGGVIQNSSVTLTVTASPVLLPSPGAVLVNYHTGDAAPGPRSIVLTASDASTVTATATTSTPWISVNQTAGSSAFSITVNPASQAQGMLSGTVTVTQAGLANSPLIIPVTLINNGGSSSGNGLLTLIPTGLTFNAAVNGGSPAAQIISVSAASQTSFSVGASTTGGGNWLVVSVSGGVTPATLTIFVNSAGLALGSYNGTLTFTSNGVNQTVPVVLNVTQTGGGGGTIISDHTSLSFSAQAGGTSPASQTINITSTGSTQVGVLVSTTTANGVNWLSTGGVGSGTTPLPVPVSVNLGTLAAGTYTGSILVSPVVGGTASVTISVTLIITSPTVSASPTSLIFTYRAGDPAPASQTISVTGGAGLTFTATATSSSGWLAVSPVAGFTPGTLTVSIAPTGLNATPTPYTGTITVAGSGTAVGTTTINVTLTVTAPLPTVSKVTNAGSFATASSISPGEIITLFASDSQHPIGPSTAAGLTLDSSGTKVLTTIGGVQVLAGGFACPMIYASATQVSAVVPYELALFTNQRVDVFVKFLGQSSNAVSEIVATTQPGLFTQNSSGTGPGAILNSNGSVNSPSNPAPKGDVVVIYMTGEGQTTPAGVTGKVTSVGSAPQFTPAPLLPVSILIGPSGSQQSANYIYAGEAPNIVSGAMQLNVVLPASINSGDQQIIVSIGPNSSQTGVTVSVR